MFGHSEHMTRQQLYEIVWSSPIHAGGRQRVPTRGEDRCVRRNRKNVRHTEHITRHQTVFVPTSVEHVAIKIAPEPAAFASWREFALSVADPPAP
jgi:hypothetical protein